MISTTLAAREAAERRFRIVPLCLSPDARVRLPRSAGQ